jgi:hypothetical protein
MTQAQQNLQQSEALLAANDHRRAYERARHAVNTLGQVQRTHWQQMTRAWGSAISSPLAVSHATLPQHGALEERLQLSRRDANRLVGGDFEDLSQMHREGWRHVQYPIEGVRTAVELWPVQPRSGRFSMRLSARAEDPNAPPHLLITPPVWVVTPPVEVAAGQVLRIHGWARVSEPIRGSVDGLLVIDSLGGEPLAERIGQSHTWREFTLYRAALESGSMTVRFALSGLGTAEVDEVTVCPLRTVQRLPGAQSRVLSDRFQPPIVR